MIIVFTERAIKHPRSVPGKIIEGLKQGEKHPISVASVWSIQGFPPLPVAGLGPPRLRSSCSQTEAYSHPEPRYHTKTRCRWVPVHPWSSLTNKVSWYYLDFIHFV